MRGGQSFESMTALEAFDAMRFFLEAYWERGGKTSDDLAVLLGSLDRGIASDQMPLDEAQWHDWIAACKASSAALHDR